MTRLFLAIPLPGDEADLLWQSREGMRFSSPRIRWIEPSQFHITLLFFGETESSCIPDICEAMDRAAELFPSPVLEADGPGQFPSRGEPRVVVEHLKDVSGRSGKGGCLALQQFLNSALSSRFTLEKRKFKAHVTLARVRRGAGILPFDSSSAPRGLLLHPRELVLFESILRPEGALYSPVYSRVLEG